jgi:hypothetical protein
MYDCATFFTESATVNFKAFYSLLSILKILKILKQFCT